MYKEIIKEFQEDFPKRFILPRKIDFPYDILNLNKIITFVGPRRAGKTYFMFYILNNLINSGKIKLENIVFIDFAAFLDDKFDVKKLLQDFYELYPNEEPFFVFDEIQDLDNFGKIVLYLFNKGYKIFLSGSNSNLLSGELKTQFRGRTFEIKVFPLSFEEFLEFKNIEKIELYTAKSQAFAKNLLTEYMKFGAYPEIVLVDNKDIKFDLIKNYFEVLLYKDLVERYGIENDYVLKVLLKKVILSNTKIFSVNKIFRELKSQNIKIGVQTLYNYLEYLKEIFFQIELNDKYKKQGKKYYLTDVAYTNLIVKNNFGQRFENIIFLTLYRKINSINFLRNNGGEIDFVLNDKIAIQVCFNLNFENFEREAKLLKKTNFEKKYIIYFEKEKDFSVDGIEILSYFEFLSKVNSYF